MRPLALGLGVLCTAVMVDGFSCISMKSPIHHPRSRIRPIMKAQEKSILDRRNFLSTGLVLGVCIGISQVDKVSAFCGEPFPDWAYSLAFEEGVIPYRKEGYKGNIFIRVVGEEKKEEKAKVSPLVLIPSGPGLSHEYLETLEAAAKDGRRVISWDPLGTGGSSGFSDSGTAPPTLESQLREVLLYLDIKKYHIYAHGTGAAAALASSTAGVKSIILASPLSDVPNFSNPKDTYSSTLLASATARGGMPCLKASIIKSSTSSSDGSSDGEFLIPQAASDQGPGLNKVKKLLEKVRVPILVTYGLKDAFLSESAVQNLIKEANTLCKNDSSSDSASVSSDSSDDTYEKCVTVEVKKFKNSGHLPHLEEREEYAQTVLTFLNSVDGI